MPTHPRQIVSSPLLGQALQYKIPENKEKDNLLVAVENESTNQVVEHNRWESGLPIDMLAFR